MARGAFKIQEMMFVLLAFALLAAIVFIFFIRLQSVNLTAEAEAIYQKDALILRERIAALPELRCSRIDCIDKDKAKIIGKYDLEDLFQGLAGARIVPIYPEGGEIILYSKDKQDRKDYSTYVNLCCK